MPEIVMDRVSFNYKTNTQEKNILDDITLKINDGEFVCIIGQSGCGKTTLLRLLAGLEKPVSGNIYFDGKAIEEPGTGRAIVFQNYSLFPWMTARKNVRFGIRQSKKEINSIEIKSMADEFLQKVGMYDDADKYPYQLSGGMRQRVAIARALAMDRDILLLDEPFGALDARNRRELQELLISLWNNNGEKKKTVVFVTHDINEAVWISDRIIFMRPGIIDADIPVDIPRPRDISDPEIFKRLRALPDELMDLFYRDQTDYEIQTLKVHHA